jgi:hypothetical protein
VIWAISREERALGECGQADVVPDVKRELVRIAAPSFDKTMGAFGFSAESSGAEPMPCINRMHSRLEPNRCHALIGCILD